MTKRMIAAFTFTTLSTVLLYAQTFVSPANPVAPLTPAQIVANEVARLTALLTLTTAQQGDATTIFTTEQTALSGIETNLQAAQTALQTAVTANNAAGITTEATMIGTLTTQQVQAQGTAEAAFYAILTTDQQTKYNDLHNVGIGGFGGFGGPGGPGNGTGHPGGGNPGGGNGGRGPGGSGQ